MKYVKRNRSAARLQMKCFKCRGDCAPKDGDWHDGEHNQVFICHVCVGRARPTLAARSRSILTVQMTGTQRTV
jgi:hypothetical protein